jgi:hypothetical protein
VVDVDPDGAALIPSPLSDQPTLSGQVLEVQLKLIGLVVGGRITPRRLLCRS